MRRPAHYFRAGVGAVITDGRGRVLVLERRDIPGAWQFPQGGMESEEEPIDSALREVEEETGLPRTSLQQVRRYPGLLAYELPHSMRSAKTGRGQVQYWFLFRLKRPAAIALRDDSEFLTAAWVRMGSAVARAVGFRKAVYRELRSEFGPAIDRSRQSTRTPRSR